MSNNSNNLPSSTSPRERGVSPTTTMKNIPIEGTIATYSLPQMVSKLYGDNWRDVTRAKKLLFISRWQETIDLITDLKPVFSVSALHELCVLQDVRVKKCNTKTMTVTDSPRPPTRPSVSAFLEIMWSDGFLDLKIVRTGYLKPAKIYYVRNTPLSVVDKYIVYYKACEEDYQRKKKPKKMTIAEQKEYWKGQKRASVEVKTEMLEEARKVGKKAVKKRKLPRCPYCGWEIFDHELPCTNPVCAQLRAENHEN